MINVLLIVFPSFSSYNCFLNCISGGCYDSAFKLFFFYRKYWLVCIFPIVSAEIYSVQKFCFKNKECDLKKKIVLLTIIPNRLILLYR